MNSVLNHHAQQMALADKVVALRERQFLTPSTDPMALRLPLCPALRQKETGNADHFSTATHHASCCAIVGSAPLQPSRHAIHVRTGGTQGGRALRWPEGL